MMATPTRFPYGVTNVLPTHPLYKYTGPDPSKTATFFTDFFTYASGDWSTASSTGSPTIALAAGSGGLLSVATATSANDTAYLAKTPASLKMVAGKQAWFRANISVDTNATATTVVGLVAGTAFSEVSGVWFKTAAGGDLTFAVGNGTTATTVATGTTLVDATAITVAAYYDGKSTVYYAINDAIQGSLTLSAIPTANLAPVVAIETTSAAARTLTADWVFAATER